MPWIRVAIHDMSKFRFPDICANCLQSPAETPTPIVRSVGGPFVGSLTTQAAWPFCKRCSDWTTRSGKWSRRYAIFPAGVLAGFALLAALFRADDGSFINPVSLWLLLASFLLAIVGCFIATTLQWLAPLPDSCISNFPTVKPLRGGQAMFSSRTFAVFAFRNPLYVEALLAANEPDNVKCKTRVLEKAKASFHKWAAKSNQSKTGPGP